MWVRRRLEQPRVVRNAMESMAMLVIRQVQVRRLGDEVRDRFESTLVRTFLDIYPRECRQAGGEEAIAAWVRHGLEAAVASGYHSRHGGCHWLALRMMLGVDFAIDPQLPWVQDCLDPVAVPDPIDRLNLVHERALDYLGETAGEDAEFVVRALLRARALDLSTLAATDEGAWRDQCCDLLRQIYPHKVAVQGGPLVSATVERDILRARGFGLQGLAGEFVFVLLSFMLGSGIDHDPLHPWVGEVLRDPDQASRAQRLQAAARAHVEQSLRAG